MKKRILSILLVLALALSLLPLSVLADERNQRPDDGEQQPSGGTTQMFAWNQVKDDPKTEEEDDSELLGKVTVKCGSTTLTRKDTETVTWDAVAGTDGTGVTITAEPGYKITSISIRCGAGAGCSTFANHQADMATVYQTVTTEVTLTASELAAMWQQHLDTPFGGFEAGENIGVSGPHWLCISIVEDDSEYTATYQNAAGAPALSDYVTDGVFSADALTANTTNPQTGLKWNQEITVDSLTDDVLAAARAEGYEFSGWQVQYQTEENGDWTDAADADGNAVVAAGAKVAVHGNVRFLAQWEEIPTGTLTVTKTVSGLENGATLPNNFTITVKQGTATVATLTLSDATGSGSSSAPYTWTIPDLPYGTYSVTEDGCTISGYALDSEESTTSGSATLSAAARTVSVDLVNAYNKDDSQTQQTSYTVEHVVDGVKKDSDTYTGTAWINDTAPQIEIQAGSITPKTYTGYKYDAISPNVKEGDKVASGATITLSYVRDDSQTKTLRYTVEYYKDGEKVDADTQTETAAVWVNDPDTLPVDASKINTTDKYVGYKFDKTEPETIPAAIADKGVIRVYYVRDSFGYTVEYYYDGVIDNDATVTESALFGSEITQYTDKAGTGYVLDAVENLPLTISADESANVIRVYYAEDVKGDPDENGNERGDGIADKYQVFVKYEAGDHGSLEGTTYKAYDLRQADAGELLTSVTLEYPTTKPDSGYEFSGWTNPTGVTVEGTVMSGFAVGTTYTFTAHFAGYPVIEVEKTLKTEMPEKGFKIGATVQWEIKVSNIGTADATGLSLSDTLTVGGRTLTLTPSADGLDAGNFAVAAGASVSFTAEYTVTGDDLGLVLRNKAVVTVSENEKPEDSDEQGKVENPYSQLSVTKTRTSAARVKASDTIEWTITIANSGNSTAKGVKIEDILSNGSAVTVTLNGESVTEVDVPAGESVVLKASYLVVRADAGKTLTNAVTVTGENGSVSDTDEGTEVERINTSTGITLPALEKGTHFNYIMGYSDGTIRPNNEITRAEVAIIFFRLLTEESRTAYYSEHNDFTDVAETSKSNIAISTLTNAGILTGYSDGTFRPNAKVTRGQLAAIIARFAEMRGSVDKSFSDIDGYWAKDLILLAASNGWIDGYVDGTFRPAQNITRAQTMAIINRALDRQVSYVADLLEDMNVWVDNRDPSAWYYFHVQEATNYHAYERKAGTLDEHWTKKLPDIDWSVYQY